MHIPPHSAHDFSSSVVSCIDPQTGWVMIMPLGETGCAFGERGTFPYVPHAVKGGGVAGVDRGKDGGEIGRGLWDFVDFKCHFEWKLSRVVSWGEV